MTSTTDKLLTKYGELFEKVTTHQLPAELCEGSLGDRTLSIYLAQDLQFFEENLRLLCKITMLSPTSMSLITLAKKIGDFARDENTYFHDVLKLLESNSGEDFTYWLNHRLPGVECYTTELVTMVHASSKYAELITYLWTSEVVYWQWAHHLHKSSKLHWKYQTWIDLHDGEDFQEWCNFLKNEVNRHSAEEVGSIFEKFLKLEYGFFESCYNA